MPPGRPKAESGLTDAQIQKLAAMGCSDQEIAELAGMAESTLQVNFRAHLTKGRGQLRQKLRRKQIARAMDGSDTMLIWLGKQYLSQRDKADINAELTATVKGYVGVSPDDWDDAPTDPPADSAV